MVSFFVLSAGGDGAEGSDCIEIRVSELGRIDGDPGTVLSISILVATAYGRLGGSDDLEKGGAMTKTILFGALKRWRIL
jgi:hypothetical protein